MIVPVPELKGSQLMLSAGSVFRSSLEDSKSQARNIDICFVSKSQLNYRNQLSLGWLQAVTPRIFFAYY